MAGLAETAKLTAELSLTGNFAKELNNANNALNTFGTRAAGGISRVGTAASKMGGAFQHAGGQIRGLLTGPLGLIGLAGGAIGVERAMTGAVESAASFQQQMELIATQAHASQAEVDAMTKAVLAMAGSVATAPEELAKGLYHLESAGFRGAVALNALKIAAEGAKVGHANLEDVTNALDAVLVAGGSDAKNLAGAMGQLNAIVGAGDMRMQDLADAMGTGILAAAHTFGLSLKDIGGALATMGDNNIRGAEAATKLRMSLALMAAPSAAAAKALKKIGLGPLDLANDMRKGGLISALVDLKQHLKDAGLTASEQAYVISHAFGGGKSGTTIMLLLQQLDRLKSKTTEIGQASGSFNADWAKTVALAQTKFDKFGAAMSALGIRLGNALLPIATDLADAFSKFIDENGPQIDGFFKSLGDTVRGFGAAVNSTIVPMFQAVVAGWNSIPAEFRDLLVKGAVVDRTVKFLFGFSPIGAAASGIGNLLKTVINSTPLGRLVGGALVPHVWVDNMGTGIGGPASLVEDATAAIAGVSAATIAVIAAAAAGSAFAFINTYNGPKANAPGSYTPTLGSAFDNRPVQPSDFTALGKAIGDQFGVDVHSDMEAIRGIIKDYGSPGPGGGSQPRQEARRGAQMDALSKAEIAAAVKTGTHAGVGHDIETLRGAIMAGLRPKPTGGGDRGKGSQGDMESRRGQMADALQVALRGKATSSDIEAARGSIADRLMSTQSGITGAVQGTTSAVFSIDGAIRSMAPPQVTVNVAVSGTSVTQKHTVIRRAGPTSGSRNSGPTYGPGKKGD